MDAMPIFYAFEPVSCTLEKDAIKRADFECDRHVRIYVTVDQ